MSQALFPSILLPPLLALALLFSGCDILKSLGLFPNDDEEPAPRVFSGKPVPGAAEMVSIKAKFGVPETGTAGVDAAFRELSAFIQGGGLTDDATENVIRLGDWIDMDGGLTVAAYDGIDGNGGGGFSSGDDGMKWDDDITLNGNPQGKMKRLIVVGINSFTKNGDDTQHVVFQFQNIPVLRRMNPSDAGNTGGYPASEMRKYVTENFLPGLIAAGVPDGVLWSPARVLSNGNNGTGSGPVSDLLWLPTEREMFQNGKSVLNTTTYGPYSANGETQENQARLEYYTSNESCLKVYKTNNGYPEVEQTSGNTGHWYWESSAYATGTSWFCCVGSGGRPSNAGASEQGGCAPAFCVN
jgi:hypothetical protein